MVTHKIANIYFLLEVDTFCALYSLLSGHHFLVDSRRKVTIEKIVVIFYVLVGHAQGKRIVRD